MSIVSDIISCGGTTAPTDKTKWIISLWYTPEKDNKFSTTPQVVRGYFETYAQAESFSIRRAGDSPELMIYVKPEKMPCK
jgi:hypothetical protein